MANGDISVEQMAEWSKDKPVSDKLDIIYLILKNQSHTCTERPEKCDKRYVTRQWLKLRVIFFAGASSSGGVVVILTVAKLLGVL